MPEDPSLEDRLQARVAAVRARFDAPVARRLLDAAGHASTAVSRVTWLHRAADLYGQAATAAQASPCRRGCAHCCHISVLLTRTEAAAIARATGAPINESAGTVVDRDQSTPAYQTAIEAQREHAIAAFTGTPCPFLRDGDCSIYKHRPLACRLHISLADAAAPCELSESGQQVRVPYLDTFATQVDAAFILGPSQPVADIREWFARCKPLNSLR